MKASHPSVVSPKLLAAFFAGSLGLAYVLIPKKAELYGRLIADGREERAVELFGEQEPVIADLGLGELMRAALRDSDPAKAVAYGEQLLQSGDPYTPADLSDLISSYRYTSRPADALATLDRLIALRKESTLPDDSALDHERGDLLMELSRPDEAFDCYRAVFAASEHKDHLDRLLQSLIQSASYSGRSSELRPLYEDLLDESPENRMSIGELAALHHSGADKDVAAFLRAAIDFAKLCEWSDAPDQAFDYYLKAAALGDRDALTRCVDLNEGLYRHPELGELLLTLVPVPDHDEYTLVLARILGESGRHDEALKYYLAHLEKHPDDGTVMFEVGALYEEANEEDKALPYYKAALAKRPEDPDIVVRIAEIHVDHGDYAAALEFYKTLPEDKHTDRTLEEYTLLSESLGDYIAFNRALQIDFARTESPNLEQYLDLAESYRLNGDTEAEFQVLRGALHSLPNNLRVALELAEAFYREGAYVEAAELLATLDLRETMQGCALFIELCSTTDDYEMAAKHFPLGVEERFDFNPSVRIALAQIYEEIKRQADADSLYASVPKGEPAWQIVATARYRVGDLFHAELYQEKFLSGTLDARPEDWTFMGDIYKSLGKDQLAADAYERSLKLIKNEFGLRRKQVSG
jgi:tetratricopeptide (TPR) repeat protein